MKLRSMLLAAPLALLALPFVAAQDQDGGLVRVRPLDEGAATEAQEGDQQPFDPQAWRRALAGADLDLRQRDFERLVRLARRGDEAWTFLKELSQDASAPELAWTARLALRELETAGPRSFFRPFAGPGVRLSDPFSDLSELLEQMGAPGLPGSLHLHGGQGASAQDRRISIQHDGGEWRVRIVETKDGQESTREFSGPSMEAILEQNPELADDLGVFHLGGPGDFRMESGLPLDTQLDDLFEGFGGFRRLHPSYSFEFPGADGTPRQLRFLITPQTQSRPTRTDVLGVRVSPVTAEGAQELGRAGPGGLYVQASFPGTIAHLLGVKSGDVLIELDGKPLGSAEDITSFMRERAEAQALRLTWIDGSGERIERTWAPAAPAAPAEQREGRTRKF